MVDLGHNIGIIYVKYSVIFSPALTSGGSTCMLPGCTRVRHLDEASGREYDFCTRRHAEQYKMVLGTCKYDNFYVFRFSS